MRTATPHLWRAWRARRETKAFEALVRPEVPYALALARRMGASPADADDVVQESLILLAREKSDEPLQVGLRAWICRRVVLRVKMQARASSRRRRHEQAVPRTSGEPDPHAPLEVQEEVETALRHLDDSERRAVLLRYLHDLDYREIAYVLGVTENACRIRVHKAIKRLRGLLGGDAPALIAAIGLPAAGAKASLVKGAVAAASATSVGVKVAGAAVVAAAAVTTVAVVLPREEEPAPVAPPPIVAVAEPEPPPPPPPPPVVEKEEPKPEPPPEPRTPRAIELLDEHLQGQEGAMALLWDFDALARHLPVPDTEPLRIESRAPVTAVELGVIAGAAPRLEFGPGVFRLSVSRWPFHNVEGVVPALEIRGAGMNRTTLVAEGDLLYVRGVHGSVRLSGFTFEGEELIDVRGAAAALVEDVRLRRWSPAGYVAAVGLSGRALLAFRRCEFLGGYKRLAGGHALAPRGDVLALFDSCRFVDLDTVLPGPWNDKPTARSLVHFRDCEFENARVVDRRFERNRRPPYPLRVRGGTIEYGADRFLKEGRLERWGRGYLREFTGARLVPGTLRCTLGDLREAIDSVRPQRGERIAGVRALVWADSPLEYYAVHLAGPGDSRRTVLVRHGREIEHHDFRLPRFPPRSDVYRGPSLSRILARHWRRLDPGLEAYAVYEEALNSRDGPVPVVYIVDALGERLLYIDPATGRLER